MSRIFHFTLCFAVILSLTACRGGADISSHSDPPPEVTSLIDNAAGEVGGQRFDSAMEKALSALELSRQQDSPLGEVRSLSTIVGIDIMASRDADAWEKAMEAESIARKNRFDKELADILISKAKLCSYAEISPETGRNDEGLEYAQEALSLAEKVDAAEQQAEACFVIGSLYINKNRWNDPIDQDLYRTAGEWLEKGQAIADSAGIPRLRRNGIMFRSRWFQQGDRNEEAIRYFEKVLEGLDETDYVTAAALDDRLVRLYTRTGEYQKALDTHDDYVFRMQKYIQQKQDETLQEMETRFKVLEKDRLIERNRYKNTILVLLALLAFALSMILWERIIKARRKNKELEMLNTSRQQIIELLSKDLKSPTASFVTELDKLSSEAPNLTPEEIRRRCLELSQSTRTFNEEVASYVGNILIDRGRRIADIGLSQREIQIIRLTAEGLKASEIAERIFLSVHTVNTHRQRIYAKMGVKNVSELIRKATELGII